MRQPSRVRLQRAERKRARRRHRLDTGRRPRRRRVDKDEAERYIELLLGPIRAQSRPRQKALDAEAKRRRKARQDWLPKGRRA